MRSEKGRDGEKRNREERTAIDELEFILKDWISGPLYTAIFALLSISFVSVHPSQIMIRISLPDSENGVP